MTKAEYLQNKICKAEKVGNLNRAADYKKLFGKLTVADANKKATVWFKLLSVLKTR